MMFDILLLLHIFLVIVCDLSNCVLVGLALGKRRHGYTNALGKPPWVFMASSI